MAHLCTLEERGLLSCMFTSRVAWQDRTPAVTAVKEQRNWRACQMLRHEESSHTLHLEREASQTLAAPHAWRCRAG